MTEWMESAACRGADPDLWTDFTFKADGRVRQAIRVCQRCEVVQQCGEWAAASPFPFRGVAGGRLWIGGRLAPSGVK